MTKHQRVQAALRGDEVDRVPVSAWGHDFLREWSAEGLAQATVEAYRRFDWDFVKVNPRASYYAEAWGAVYKPSGLPDKSPFLAQPAIKSVTDLDNIQPIDVSTGPFGEQVDAVSIIAQEIGSEVPTIQTVFSPLGVISRLAGSVELVQEMMKVDPGRLETALSVVAEALAAYVRLCLGHGISGIFFATVDWGSQDTISIDDYQRFSRPYDLTVLEAARDSEFNVFHVCRDNNLLTNLLDYPVHAFHWATPVGGKRSNPSLSEVLALTDRAVMGGASSGTDIAQEDVAVVAVMARDAIRETSGRRFLLAPGCSVPPSTPEATLRALREAVEG